MSSGFADSERAIQSRVVTEWADATPVKWPNVDFAQPKGTPWIAVHIQDAGAVKGAIGSGTGSLERYAGVLICQVFAPEDTGTAIAKGLADDFAALFKDIQISSGSSGTITFDLPSFREIGTVESGLYQINVNCPFRRDRFET